MRDIAPIGEMKAAEHYFDRVFKAAITVNSSFGQTTRMIFDERRVRITNRSVDLLFHKTALQLAFFVHDFTVQYGGESQDKFNGNLFREIFECPFVD